MYRMYNRVFEYFKNKVIRLIKVTNKLLLPDLIGSLKWQQTNKAEMPT